MLYTALAFGNAIVASSVGGFTEVGERDGALRLVAPGDPAALHDALAELLGDEGARWRSAAAAQSAAATTYSWARIAAHTLDIYRRPDAADDARAARSSSGLSLAAIVWTHVG